MSNPEPSSGPAWRDAQLADPHGQPDKAARVQAMFDAIAPRYERVNTVATFGRDASWRKRAIAAAWVRPTDVVLDVACGTGDMVRAFAEHDPPPARIIGLDFAAGMLAHFRPLEEHSTPIHLVRGDAQRLPLRDNSVDVVTCAFGIRNFQDLQAGLGEMGRVLRSEGRLAILEFALPPNVLLRWPYRFYTEFVLPRLGNWISRDSTGAYRYLPSSINHFTSEPEIVQRLGKAGLTCVHVQRMNFGGVVLYSARKR